jgi:hypothetical protein
MAQIHFTARRMEESIDRGVIEVPEEVLPHVLSDLLRPVIGARLGTQKLARKAGVDVRVCADALCCLTDHLGIQVRNLSKDSSCHDP